MEPTVSYTNVQGGLIIHQMKAYGVLFSNISIACPNNFLHVIYQHFKVHKWSLFTGFYICTLNVRSLSTNTQSTFVFTEQGCN